MKCLKLTLEKIETNKLINNISQKYYKYLYSEKRNNKKKINTQIKNMNSKMPPEVSKTEMRRALKELKNNKHRIETV